MSQSNCTTLADGSDQPSAVLQDDFSLRKETAKVPLVSAHHIQTTDTVGGPHGAHEAALSPSTSNQKIGGSEGDIAIQSGDQSEQRQSLGQVSGQTNSPCAQCSNVNTGLVSAIEDVSMDGFEGGNSTGQSAIAKSLSAQTGEPLFEDISMDGEVRQDAMADRAGQDVNVHPLSDSGGLKMDTPGKSNVLQMCFTGVLNSGDGSNSTELCNQSSTPQESKSYTETTSGLSEDCKQCSNTTQEKNRQNGNGVQSHSSGNQSSIKRSKRKRHRRDETMEHSGLEYAASKQAKQSKSDELVKCLRLQGVSEDSSPKEVAEELVRCLHEPKFHLVKQVVTVLGVKQTLELFHETSRIQEEGGQFTIDGGKRRSPGGMFLTLVKNCTTVTPEQKKEIFQVDKNIIAKRQREEKRRLKRKREEQLLKKKAEWQLEVFRAQLEGRAPDSIVGRRFGEHRNMHKRLFGTTAQEIDCGNEDSQKVNPAVDLRHKITTKAEGKPDGVVQSENGQSSVQEVVEQMEVEGCESAISSSSSGLRESGMLAETARLRGQESGVPQLSTEEKLAEEFEQMNECDLDVEIELDL